jgi:hypothetical protein
MDKRRELVAEKDTRAERDANPSDQWEYLARNLKKLPGLTIEVDFNKLGRQGWEFASVADGYAIFKRRLPCQADDAEG